MKKAIRAWLISASPTCGDEDFGKGARHHRHAGLHEPRASSSGEGHRVDGRSDIFSLGVVFYELLAGRRPFQGDGLEDVLDQIKKVEARPPRQIDDAIPKELERICLKALAKRAADRYTTARDMAEDLHDFVKTAPAGDRRSFLTLAPSRGQRPERSPAEAVSGISANRPIGFRPAVPPRSCPRGSGPSTSTTPTFSSSCFLAHETAMDCPKASGSGRHKSRPPTPKRPFEWA